MEVTAAIQKRCSIRRFKATPVEKAKIEKVLEAGRRAPSWGNTQPWRFIVVQDKAKIAEIAKAGGGQPQAGGAPVLIVCCATIDDFTKKGHGEALMSLIPVGAMTEELKDYSFTERRIRALPAGRCVHDYQSRRAADDCRCLYDA